MHLRVAKYEWLALDQITREMADYLLFQFNIFLRKHRSSSEAHKAPNNKGLLAFLRGPKREGKEGEGCKYRGPIVFLPDQLESRPSNYSAL